MPCCTRCGSPYSLAEGCPCRRTPTVRPSSSSTQLAISPGELAAQVRLALHKLGISFDYEGRARATEAVLDAIPTELIVDARHLLKTFAAWEHETPGNEVRALEIRRYLDWLQKLKDIK